MVASYRSRLRAGLERSRVFPLDLTPSEVGDAQRTIALLRDLYENLAEHLHDPEIRWEVWSRVKAANRHLDEILERRA
jgi:hypothetical protein